MLDISKEENGQRFNPPDRRFTFYPLVEIFVMKVVLNLTGGLKTMNLSDEKKVVIGAIATALFIGFVLVKDFTAY